MDGPMILVDTSVWIDHLRTGNQALARLLENEEVFGHPFVTGELACGNLRNREEILFRISSLPQATMADHAEVLRFVEQYELMGRGVAWIDLHLLCSAVLSHARFWTLDTRAARVAAMLDFAYSP